MTSEFEYFEKDGAYFRKRKALKMPAVEHVRHGNNWVPYTGDRLAPVVFGSEVDQAEAEDGMANAEPPESGAAYDYFEHEGAFFRREKALGLMGVQEIRGAKGWKPYEGDSMAPSMFGSRISKEKATRGMTKAEPTKSAGGFDYFEHDGSFFRAPKNLGTMSVTHIRAGDRWEPYKGDRLAPAHFGSVVSEEKATRGMTPGASQE